MVVHARLRDGDEGGGGNGTGKFLTGFLIGGVVCGVAGVLFAPQLSKTLLKGKDTVGKFLYEVRGTGRGTGWGLCIACIRPRVQFNPPSSPLRWFTCPLTRAYLRLL